jgi:hypothetical protein
MDTFTPLFSKIVDSSLWDEPDHVVKVFLTMLALKDADHVVRKNAYELGRKCWPKDNNAEAKVLEALKVLSKPDKRRLEPQPHEGRRIQKVEDGWLVLNGAHYRKMAQEVADRFRKARWARENRTKVPVENKPDLVRTLEANANTSLRHARDLRNEIADEAARKQQEDGIL